MPRPWLPVCVALLCLLPIMWLGGMVGLGKAGANPIETINRFTGDWALRMLLVSLAVAPLLRFGVPWLAPFRRMLGLFAFFYVFCHLLSYVGLDLLFDWSAFWQDIQKRTFITLGMAAALLMLPLAIISLFKLRVTHRALFRLIYPITVLALAHHWLMVKADTRPALIHAAIFAILMLARLPMGKSR